MLFDIFLTGLVLLILGCRKPPEIERPIIELGEREPVFSLDGKFIAYVDNNDISRICLLELETENVINLTYGWSPDWAPDGKWIVYVWARDVYKINIETKEIKQLTTWGACFFPDWHPNGKRIAFDFSYHTAGFDSFGIWILNLDDNSAKHLGGGREPDWSSSGERLVHIRYVAGVTFPEIFIMDSSGNNSVRLTNNQVDDDRPVLSPDGSKTAYVSETKKYYNIFSINTNGTNKVQLTSEPESDNGYMSCEPAWSPDGHKIVYAHVEWFEDEHRIDLIGHLWIMDADGKNKKQLTGKQ